MSGARLLSAALALILSSRKQSFISPNHKSGRPEKGLSLETTVACIPRTCTRIMCGNRALPSLWRNHNLQAVKGYIAGNSTATLTETQPPKKRERKKKKTHHHNHTHTNGEREKGSEENEMPKCLASEQTPNCGPKIFPVQECLRQGFIFRKICQGDGKGTSYGEILHLCLNILPRQTPSAFHFPFPPLPTFFIFLSSEALTPATPPTQNSLPFLHPSGESLSKMSATRPSARYLSPSDPIRNVSVKYFCTLCTPANDYFHKRFVKRPA